jgi:hypothetical protein
MVVVLVNPVVVKIVYTLPSLWPASQTIASDNRSGGGVRGYKPRLINSPTVLLHPYPRTKKQPACNYTAYTSSPEQHPAISRNDGPAMFTPPVYDRVSLQRREHRQRVGCEARTIATRRDIRGICKYDGLRRGYGKAEAGWWKDG